jgi:hypothetical protein
MCPVSDISKKLLVQVPDSGARHDICLLKMNSVEALVLTTKAFICFFVREDLTIELPGVKQLKLDSVHLLPFIVEV